MVSWLKPGYLRKLPGLFSKKYFLSLFKKVHLLTIYQTKAREVEGKTYATLDRTSYKSVASWRD